MTSLEIKQLLDEKYQEYCHSDFFIHTDPIQIPKLFEEKEDIEIAGFLAASLAWGQRSTIIKKCKELMQLLDYDRRVRRVGNGSGNLPERGRLAKRNGIPPRSGGATA